MLVRYQESPYALVAPPYALKLRRHFVFCKELLFAVSGARWLLNFTYVIPVFQNEVTVLYSEESTLGFSWLKNVRILYCITSRFIDLFVFILWYQLVYLIASKWKHWPCLLNGYSRETGQGQASPRYVTNEMAMKALCSLNKKKRTAITEDTALHIQSAFLSLCVMTLLA